MNSHPRMQGTLAFSLVEVVIAIGVMAIVLVGVFVLLGVSLESSRSSATETALASMSRQVVTALRAEPFGNLPSEKTFYFDQNGTLTTSTHALYRCESILTDDLKLPSGNLKKVLLKFAWPTSSQSEANTRYFYSGIANYGS